MYSIMKGEIVMSSELDFFKKMPNLLKLQNTNPDFNTLDRIFSKGIVDAKFLLEAKKNLDDQTLIDAINSLCDRRIHQYLNTNFVSPINGGILNIMDIFDRLRAIDSPSIISFIDSLQQRLNEGSPVFSQNITACQEIINAYRSYTQLHDAYIEQLGKGNDIFNHKEIFIKYLNPGEQAEEVR